MYRATWCLRHTFESGIVCKAALLLQCEGVQDSGCAQQFVRSSCASGVAEAGAQPLDTLKAEQELCRAGVREVPARWLRRQCCQAMVSWVCSVGQCWVSVPGQELVSGEL